MSVREIDKTELRIRPAESTQNGPNFYNLFCEYRSNNYNITFLFLVYLFWDFDTK